MFDKGATAVVATPTMPFIIAVKKDGIYSFENGDWNLQYSMTQGIYKLVPIGPYLFGIGDHGTIIRYCQVSQKWTQTAFPTTQRLWDISGTSEGYIVTHGGSRLFTSSNFGSRWSIVAPFAGLEKPPLIRSLFYHKNHIYIGTQINKRHGGLWRYSLGTCTLELMKKESHSMISAIYIDAFDRIFLTKGNGQNNGGVIEMRKSPYSEWQVLNQPIFEKAFLDLFASKEKIFATTCRDEYGYSRIYQLDPWQLELNPIETVSGHSYRGACHNDQLLIAGSDESKWIHSSSKKYTYLH